jgi:hypothetical protein
MSQKMVTMSRQNSEGNGFGDQMVDLIYHIPKEFCFLLRRTHVNLRTEDMLMVAAYGWDTLGAMKAGYQGTCGTSWQSGLSLRSAARVGVR